MKFEATKLQGLYLISLEPVSDSRGWFSRTFCKEEFEKIDHKKEWVQMNHSFTKYKGTIRGMHYQVPPFSEVKMVRCVAGAVFDVVVDIRKDSKTFLQWQGVNLSAENKQMLYIPEGFAHGFQTLTDECELLYHHTAMYRPGAEGGLRYNDPMIGIEWPLPANHLSERDLAHELINQDFKGI